MNQNHPKVAGSVAVVIPAYNAADTITEVLGQLPIDTFETLVGPGESAR